MRVPRLVHVPVSVLEVHSPSLRLWTCADHHHCDTCCRVLNAAEFDAVYVQFYNNFCGLTNYNNPNAWNFAQWDSWAKNTSLNKDVKIFIGAPASSTAAGSGYVDAATLGKIASETRSKYSSFGGVMLWDASQAYGALKIGFAIWVLYLC